MDIKSLLVTRLDGPKDSDASELLNPNWFDIEAAIRRLDGHACTLVCLGIGEAPVPHMSVGGGGDCKYIVYATPDNTTFYNLINPQAPEGKFLLKAGGQFGEYDLKMCVGLDSALQAARMYAENGQPDPGLTWETQN